MKKSILNLQGVLELSKNEQKSIIGSGGGKRICCEWCSDGSCNGWTTAGAPCPIALPCPN